MKRIDFPVPIEFGEGIEFTGLLTLDEPSDTVCVRYTYWDREDAAIYDVGECEFVEPMPDEVLVAAQKLREKLNAAVRAAMGENIPPRLRWGVIESLLD